MIFLNLYHFRLKWQQVAQGGSGWHSQNAVPHGVLTVILHPDGRARRQCAARSPERYLPNPSPDGFLCSPEHSKVCFQPLKTF